MLLRPQADPPGVNKLLGVSAGTRCRRGRTNFSGVGVASLLPWGQRGLASHHAELFYSVWRGQHLPLVSLTDNLGQIPLRSRGNWPFFLEPYCSLSVWLIGCCYFCLFVCQLKPCSQSTKPFLSVQICFLVKLKAWWSSTLVTQVLKAYITATAAQCYLLNYVLNKGNNLWNN